MKPNISPDSNPKMVHREMCLLLQITVYSGKVKTFLTVKCHNACVLLKKLFSLQSLWVRLSHSTCVTYLHPNCPFFRFTSVFLPFSLGVRRKILLGCTFWISVMETAALYLHTQTLSAKHGVKRFNRGRIGRLVWLAVGHLRYVGPIRSGQFIKV